MTGPYPRPVEEEVTVDVGVTRERIGDVLERGIVPCANCHKPHDLRVVVPHDPTKKYPTGVRSWAGKDGHFYVKMSAEEVVRFLSRQDEDAARSVPSDRPASDPDNATLRAALRAIGRKYKPSGLYDDLMDEAASVIASHDATTPAGLDMERLALVLCANRHPVVDESEVYVDDECRALASRLIAAGVGFPAAPDEGLNFEGSQLYYNGGYAAGATATCDFMERGVLALPSEDRDGYEERWVKRSGVTGLIELARSEYAALTSPEEPR